MANLSYHGPRNVSAYLGWDHDRLGEILADVTRLAGTGERDKAAALFAEFAGGLNWHIDVEEHTLFPVFEEKTGIVQGPTTVMRDEHRQIRRLMDEVAAALNAGDLAGAGRVIGALDDLLDMHNMKEEKILYPLTDQALDVQEREALVARIERS